AASGAASGAASDAASGARSGVTSSARSGATSDAIPEPPDLGALADALTARPAESSTATCAGSATPGADATRPRAAAARPAPPAPVDGPAEWLAQGFADHLAAWAHAAGSPPGTLDDLRAAGAAVSRALAAGHACVYLSDLLPPGADAQSLRSTLLASPMTGTPAAPGVCPLVLDHEDRLYLHRYFDYERRIAARLVGRPPPGVDAAGRERLAAEIATLFAGNAALLDGAADWQKIAAALAVLGNLTVISGGPGTGKTTTVVNLLACLLTIDPDTRIALAAPTGKAAARMQDALRQRAQHLPPAVQARLPATAFTIHRLLGFVPGKNIFRHGADHPLAIDVLVVDEASMLDLALAAKLFEAVPTSARIVLLGDKDQLAAVESGAVFSELSADPTLEPDCVRRLATICAVPSARITPPPPARPTPLRDSVVWFGRNFRFAPDSGIGRLAGAIRAGDASAALAVLAGLRASNDASVDWLEDGAHALAPTVLARLVDGYAPYLEALAAGARDLDAVFGAFERYRILCAEREGKRGVRELNAFIGTHCRHAVEASWPSAPRSPWYYGRPVMVLANDYVLKLYNGDVGIALADAEGNLMVHFRETDGSVRLVAPVRLPEHETAYATTVHKAQGSEFDAIALVLPGRSSRVATRELVYTAVTRARQRVNLVASAEILAAAIDTPTVRHSGLITRLQEAAAGTMAGRSKGE
ncbi:MAG: exodeoxyribonuclease V subunit alpha, partial [Casimicrobiaceae bacterium]